MAVKSILFLICFSLLNVSAGWSEDVTDRTVEPVKVQIEENIAPPQTEQPDPYKDVTWDSVTNNPQNQKQTMTVYNKRTRDGDFTSVTSTGPNNAAVVVAPTERRSKKWLFW